MATVIVEKKEACCKVEDVDKDPVGYWADMWVLLLVVAALKIVLVMMMAWEVLRVTFD